MAIGGDTSLFFTDFGVDATLGGVAVRVIFDSPFAQAFNGMISGNGPQAIAPASVNAARGQSLVIGAKAYVVTGVEPDGMGLVLLRLDEQ